MNKKNFSLKILSLFFTFTFLSFLLGGCQQETTEVVSEETFTPVKTAIVKVGSIEKSMTYTGYLQPEKEIDISSKVIGEVDHVYYDIGDSVEEGTTLFTLDEKAANDSVKVLESQVETRLNQIESALEAAKIQYEDAKDKLEDMKLLYETGAISTYELENVQISYEQARINYDTAQTSYNLFMNPNENSLITQINVAKDNLNDMVVTSPISGVVAYRAIEEGEFAGSGPAFTIVDLDHVLLEISVPENIISKLELNQEVDVYVDTLDENFIGKISKIAPTADKTTLTYPVTIKISNESLKLRDGMYAEISISVEKKEEALLIDRNSILLDDQQKFIYIVDGEKARRVDVECGIDNGKMIEVVNGLEEGQEMIVKGQDYLTDGEKVKVIQ